MGGIRYGELAFDASFVFAHRAGKKLRFTRQERALLLFFTHHPRKLLTRHQLLAALADTGSGETSDRNIDYLVNRLRAKLGDNAREPAYIATQYGEGYLWVAERDKAVPSDAFLVIGPIFGLEGLSDPSTSRTFVQRLTAACGRRTSPAQRVVLAPDWRPGDADVGKTRFYVEVGFHERRGAVHAAVVLRGRSPRRILHTARLVLDGYNDLAASNELAEILRTSMWSHLAEPVGASAALTDEPLELRVHTAGLLLGRSDQSWIESGEQIARSREANPSDSKLDLMWASHLSIRLTLDTDRLSARERDAIEDEIEDIALSALPRIKQDPILSLAAAKLLLRIDRGYFEIAEELAEQAFSESAAFAATFALLGQLRAFKGDIDEALGLYERGIELCERGSEFHIFLVFLKCVALVAAARRKVLGETLAGLYAIDPTRRMEAGLLLAPALPEQLEPDLAARLDGLGAEMAGAMLTRIYYVSARHFRQEEHRANVLRGPTSQVADRFGFDVVPPEVWEAAPSLRPINSHKPAEAQDLILRS